MSRNFKYTPHAPERDYGLTAAEYVEREPRVHGVLAAYARYNESADAKELLEVFEAVRQLAGWKP